MAGPAVSFAIAAPAVIGASDPISLVLSNDSGADLDVAAGTTALVVTFGDLVPASALGSVAVVSPSGWAPAVVSQPVPALRLGATAPATIAANATLTFELSGIVVAEPTRIATLTVGPEALSNAGTEVQVVPTVVQATKPGPALPVNREVEPLQIPLQPADGPTPPISSSLALTMTYAAPPGSGPLVDPKKPGARQFYLTAVYAEPPGRSALTSKELADQYGLEARNGKVYAHPWDVSPDKGFDPPRWKARPTSPGVLDANDSVEFVLDDIVTELAEGITSIYLQYTGLPGYADGYIAFSVGKAEPPRGVVNLSLVSPTTIVGEGAVQLAWSSYVTGADEWLQLGFTENGVPRTLSSKASEIPLQSTQFQATARLLESADFTLAAFNGQTPMGGSQTVSVAVTAKPAIAQLAIAGTNPPPLDLAHPTTLTWTTTAAETCVVSVEGLDGQVVLPVAADGPMSTVLSIAPATKPGGVLAVGSAGTIALAVADPPASIRVHVAAATRQDGSEVTESAAITVPLGSLPLPVIGGWSVGYDTDKWPLLTWTAANALQAWFSQSVDGWPGFGTYTVELPPPASGATRLRPPPFPPRKDDMREAAAPAVPDGGYYDCTLTIAGPWGPAATCVYKLPG